MGSIINLIRRQYEKQMEQKWYESYYLIDCHGTIIRPNHNNPLPNKLDFYDFAKSSLQLLTKRSDIRIILYTSSHDYQIRNYINILRMYDIEFDYINDNPEIGEGDYGDYTYKPYFDIYLDDKAGFDAENEWVDIYNWLKEDNRPNIKWKSSIRERRRTEYFLAKNKEKFLWKKNINKEISIK